jgi:PTH1 family peptidyl-tRNA hydrolase
MKYLVVGLGNPGTEYVLTRHNIGFMVLDHVVGKDSFIDTKYGQRAEHRHRGRLYLLLKPNTYMNLSGKAVEWHLKENRLTPKELLVITDDLALDFGVLRIRHKGSSGGHNGLKDIIERLGTDEFSRLRIGIGNDYKSGNQVDYVLSKFREEELSKMTSVLDASLEIIHDFGFIDKSRLMSKHNRRLF